LCAAILLPCTKAFTVRTSIMIQMFGKAKCKLCGDSVRFALRHLREKHPETLKDRDVIKLNMSRILEKFFE
jgi:hypothetical protein